MSTITDANQLVSLFNRLFKESENTVLVKGGDEPIYLPAGEGSPHHRIIFTHDYCASALHEISHWCIAGQNRRKLTDFGYWYEPDGRSVDQQQAFEKVEIKPQALEWIFSEAAGMRFNISIDNLAGEVSPTEEAFKQSVQKQALSYLNRGLPRRAQLFVEALKGLQEPPRIIEKNRFTLASLS